MLPTFLHRIRTPIDFVLQTKSIGCFIFFFQVILSLGNTSLAGVWTAFTGDQLGAIFAAQSLESYKASGKPIGEFWVSYSSKYIARNSNCE